jgi:hypothetical protein
MLWRGLTVPALASAGLHGHLDGTVAAPAKTIKEGTGNATVDVPNLEYSCWWVMDQRVLSFPLGSMEPVIACQLIGYTSAMDVWAVVHRLYGTQSRANIRHVRRQLQSLRKEGVPTAQYMQQMKALGDVMAVADSPLSNDKLVDYIITGLGKEFNTITTTLTLGSPCPLMNFTLTSYRSRLFRSSKISLQTGPPRRMQSCVLASTSTLADRVLPTTRLVLLASLAHISLAIATAAMAAHMVARATPPPMIVNPPMANPVVTRIMAVTTVVAVGTTAAANAPSVKFATIGGMLRRTARTGSTPSFSLTTTTTSAPGTRCLLATTPTL